MSNVDEFMKALSGGRGDLDAWLECNNEAECREAILGALSEKLAALEASVKRQAEVIEKCQVALDEVLDLIGESTGVYGLHLNGDPSPWEELEQGGRFERLWSLPEAFAAIAALNENKENQS